MKSNHSTTEHNRLSTIIDLIPDPRFGEVTRRDEVIILEYQHEERNHVL